MIHPDVAKFKADWLGIPVMCIRFMAETTQAPYVRLRDFVVRIFSEFLLHTPLRAFGLNYGVNFPVGSPATRDRIATALAPVEPWGAMAGEAKLGWPARWHGQRGGMTSPQMSQLAPSARDPGGQINVRVEPSTQVGSSGTGVFASVNNHFASHSSASDTDI